VASFSGPIVGATILAFFSEALSAFRMYQTLVFGLVLIFTILFVPQGFMGLYPRLTPLIKRLSARNVSRAHDVGDRGRVP